MRTRSLTLSDIETGPAWVAEITLRSDRWRDDNTHALLMLDGAVPVAAGMLWTSRVHGDRYWVDVVVDPARRRRGFGSAMVASLIARRARPLPLMTRGYVGDERLAFADALGALTIQVVPPAEALTAAAAGLRGPLAGTCAGAEVGGEAVADAFARMYAWSHATWSPVAADSRGHLREGFADEVDLDATSVHVDGSGAVVAITAVFTDTDPAVLSGETVSRDVQDGGRRVESCVRRSLDTLAGRGVDRVDLDGHVSDPHLLPAWIRLAPSGRWFRPVEIPG